MIKKCIGLFLFLFLGLHLTYGQTRKAIQSETTATRLMMPSSSKIDPSLQFRMELDSVFPASFLNDCSISLVNFSIEEQWGLIGGTNGYFDLEKAQKLRYDPLKGFFVREIWGWFSTVQTVGDGNIFSKVYTLDAQGWGPGNLVAISQPLKTSELVFSDAEALPTVFPIQNPLTIRDTAFFASIDFSQLYESTDTVALWQTDLDCGDGNDSWELFSDGETWTPINNSSSWEINSNFAIAAVLEPTNLIQERLEAPVFQDTCGSSLGGYLSDGWGYVSGTNNYSDQEKAQRLDFISDTGFFVREIWGWFSDVQTVNDGPVSAKVYTVDPATGAPGELLSTSASRKTSQLAYAENQLIPTSFSFSEPVSINDISVFASIDISELYATNDTVALWQTLNDCGDGSTSWELFDDGVTWSNMINSWGLSANWLISAIIEFTTDTDDQLAFVAQNGLQLFPAFPNPTAETINFKYQLDRPESVQIEVYSTTGRLLQKHDMGRQMTGEYTEAIDVSNLPAGAYVYGIVTSSARLMSRFVVNR